MHSENGENILDLLEDLIQRVQKNSELLESIKKRRKCRSFGFETLVKDIRGDSNVDALKKAKIRIKCNPTDVEDSNYLNLKNLYDDACTKYFGTEKIPQIQSISSSARKEAKNFGIDWESELKKFSDYLKFRNNPIK